MDPSCFFGAGIQIPAHFGFWDNDPSGVLGYWNPCSAATLASARVLPLGGGSQLGKSFFLGTCFFVLVPLNLYINRIYYSVVYQSSLASLVLSGWLHQMNLIGVP